MREIKFRGKRVDNGEWIYGFYFESFTGISYILKLHDHILGITDYCEVIPESVGQYAGLHDRNSKEVYEEDIVCFTVFDYNGSDTQYKGVIKWSGTKFMIWHDNEQEFYGSDGGFDLDWVFAQDDEPEVIGNIYDNPSLLEVQP